MYREYSVSRPNGGYYNDGYDENERNYRGTYKGYRGRGGGSFRGRGYYGGQSGDSRRYKPYNPYYTRGNGRIHGQPGYQSSRRGQVSGSDYQPPRTEGSGSISRADEEFGGSFRSQDGVSAQKPIYSGINGRGRGNGFGKYRGSSYPWKGHSSHSAEESTDKTLWRPSSASPVFEGSSRFLPFKRQSPVAEATAEVEKYHNPWITIFHIEHPQTKQALEKNTIEVESINKDLAELQKAKMSLEFSLDHLSRHAQRDELNVRLATEKLEEFTYL